MNVCIECFHTRKAKLNNHRNHARGKYEVDAAQYAYFEHNNNNNTMTSLV